MWRSKEYRIRGNENIYVIHILFILGTDIYVHVAYRFMLIKNRLQYTFSFGERDVVFIKYLRTTDSQKYPWQQLIITTDVSATYIRMNQLRHWAGL